MPGPFHYSFFVTDLASTRRFYGELLGCREGRSTETWVDFDFFGHQISAHTTGPPTPTADRGVVDGIAVPMPHFGAILDWDAFPRAGGAAHAKPAAASSFRRGCDLTANPPSRRRCSSSIRAATRSNSRRSSTRITSSPVSPASAVIVGGGVIGASVAWHLAARGERTCSSSIEPPARAHGSTAAATGGLPRAVRHRDQRSALPPLARRSSCGFPTRSARTRATSRRATCGSRKTSRRSRRSAPRAEIQHREGLAEAVEVSPGDVARLQPAVALERSRRRRVLPDRRVHQAAGRSKRATVSAAAAPRRALRLGYAGDRIRS